MAGMRAEFRQYKYIIYVYGITLGNKKWLLGKQNYLYTYLYITLLYMFIYLLISMLYKYIY